MQPCARRRRTRMGCHARCTSPGSHGRTSNTRRAGNSGITRAGRTVRTSNTGPLDHNTGRRSACRSRGGFRHRRVPKGGDRDRGFACLLAHRETGLKPARGTRYKRFLSRLEPEGTDKGNNFGSRARCTSHRSRATFPQGDRSLFTPQASASRYTQPEQSAGH